MGFFAKTTSLDTRSLSAFRILIALLFLYDVLDRWLNLRAHYSDEGVLPNAIAKYLMTAGIAQPTVSKTANISLNLISGDPLWQMLVFGSAFLCGLLLLAGFKTRWTAFFCWVFATSMVNASPLLIYPGDYMLNMLLLGAVFVPLGHHFTWFKNYQPSEVSGISTLPLFAVNFLFMFGAGMAKNGTQWSSGTAVQELLLMEQYATSMRDLILPYPGFMSFMTYATVWVERLCPFLLLLPFWGGRIRMVSALTLIGFLLGVRVFVSSQNLSFICAAGYVALLPAAFWNYFPRARGLQSAPAGGTSFRYAHAALGLAAVFIVALLLLLEWNRAVRFGYKLTPIQFPAPVQRIIDIARLNNNNSMFANFKGMPDGWVVVLGQTADGSPVDLLSGKPNDLSMENRNNIADFSLRWRRFFANTFFRKNVDGRNIFVQHYAQYLCRQWAKTHPGSPIGDKVEVIRMDYQVPEGARAPASASLAFRETFSCSEPIAVNP